MLRRGLLHLLHRILFSLRLIIRDLPLLQILVGGALRKLGLAGVQNCVQHNRHASSSTENWLEQGLLSPSLKKAIVDGHRVPLLPKGLSTDRIRLDHIANKLSSLVR